jgi:hypothetical protein
MFFWTGRYYVQNCMILQNDVLWQVGIVFRIIWYCRVTRADSTESNKQKSGDWRLIVRKLQHNLELNTAVKEELDLGYQEIWCWCFLVLADSSWTQKGTYQFGRWDAWSSDLLLSIVIGEMRQFCHFDSETVWQIREWHCVASPKDQKTRPKPWPGKVMQTVSGTWGMHTYLFSV